MATISNGELEFYKKKCLGIQKKMFELAKEGNLTGGVYRSLLYEDRLYGSLIEKKMKEAKEHSN